MRTAALEIGPAGGIEAVLTTNHVQALDPEFFRSAGIPPEQRRGLVVKSSVHYPAGFEPLAAEFIQVDAPGPSSPDLRRFAYCRIRRPT